RGCAVPVAWKILPATEKHPWQPEWLALLKHFRDLVPANWTVIVLADRGLYAQWLFHAIVTLGWHPLLRINQQGQCRPQGWYHWGPFTTLVPAVGRRWQGQGTAFTGKDTQLDCTLLGWWGAGHQEAWLVLTDLPPHAAQACWYGLRAWIEHGVKRLKRGGWQWQYTRMDDPTRAERLWLAIAIATWWLLSVGGEAEAELPAATLPPVPGAARRQERGWRVVGIFRRGWTLIMAALLNQHPLPPGRGCPEPWPALLTVSDGLPTDPEGDNERNLHL
ncbi:MAG TPA: transposase, partial [Candidatus Competibacteraceae bacterium]|nr:transposase [Candidatus Competibacteraceae bacterium]